MVKYEVDFLNSTFNSCKYGVGLGLAGVWAWLGLAGVPTSATVPKGNLKELNRRWADPQDPRKMTILVIKNNLKRYDFRATTERRSLALRLGRGPARSTKALTEDVQSLTPWMGRFTHPGCKPSTDTGGNVPTCIRGGRPTREGG